MKQKRRAIISLSDKTHIEALAQVFVASDIQIIATGNTAKYLQAHGITTTELSKYTEFPEILGGRVKTLHPKVHAGILARRDQDAETLAALNIDPIDFVVVNLYPFETTQSVEQIDIGGSTLLRAAAKNHQWVSAITDPSDYEHIAREIQTNGGTTLATRKRLAAKVFALTAHYDQMISTAFQESTSDAATDLPNRLPSTFKKSLDLRYGENPQQQAASYIDTRTHHHSLLRATLLQGKPLSYNNLLDSDAALNCIMSFAKDTPACVIIKHATPCGVALGTTLDQAYQKALSCDAQSAFGGIIAVNQTLDAKTAETICRGQFVEVILAPAVEDGAAQIISQKKNLRLLSLGALEQNPEPSLEYRSVSGGLVIQTPDTHRLTTLSDCAIPTLKKPNSTEIQDLLFAWQVVRSIKSNAIVYAKDETTFGIGSGQTSRVFSAQIACLKAQQANLSLEGAVMASDAFFPFPDSLDVASEKGVTAVIQPGGSKRDPDVIARANELNLAMIFTGARHFKH